MSRYIDADALTSKVRHFFFELIDKVEPIMSEDGGAFDLKIVNPLLEANKAIASIIREQPTADVVEVVRCKDCKWYAGDGMYCANNIIVQFDHFYCYNGERREQ